MTDSPQAVESPDQLETPADLEAFENGCIDLLCKQENALSQFVPSQGQTGGAESLDLAKQMLLQFLDFAESHFDGQEFGDIATKLHAVYTRTKNHEKRVQQQTWRPLRRLFGLDCPSESELSQSYRQLCGEYTQLYKEYFAICVKRLGPDSATKKQFAQSVDVFLTELGRKW